MRTVVILSIAVAATVYIAAGCDESATSPEGDGAQAAGTFTFDRIGTRLERVWAFSQQRAFVISGQNGILDVRRGTNEPDINLMTTGVDAIYRDIWAASESNVFVVGSDPGETDGFIVRYDGRRWSEVLHPFTGPLDGVFGSSSDDVYAVCNNGDIGRFNGSTWSIVHQGPPKTIDGWANSSNDVWLVGGEGDVLRYDGTNWSSSTVPGVDKFHAVWSSGPGDAFALSTFDVYRYHDDVWSRSYDGLAYTLHAIDGSGPNNVIVAASDQRILCFDGSGWQAERVPVLYSELYGVSVTCDTHAVVVGNNGALGEWDGSGWSGRSGTGDRVWSGLGGADGVVYAGGVRGDVTRYDGGGWTWVSSVISDDVTGMWVVSPDTVFMIATDGPSSIVYRYRGTGWSHLMDFDALYGIWGTSGSDIWVVGEQGYWRYNGSHFTPRAAPGGHGIWGTSSQDVWVVGADGHIEHYNGSGWTDWTEHHDSTFYDVWGTSSKDVVAVGTNGFVRRYDGSNWSTEDTGVTATLVGVWASGPNDYWAVGESGTIVHHDGRRWHRVRFQMGVELHAVWGWDGEVFFGGSEDCLFRYSN
jgi:hypothetical protein